ncbi:MAG: hypothetical protein ABSH50_07695 [Bryobacteraceae bacterium]|jgi:hypothetical protein
MTWMPHDRELAPGVTVERRSIFWAPLALAAAVLRPARAATAAAPLNWDDFIRLCPPDAAEWARDTSEIGQDAYLNRIAAWAVRLKAAPDTRLGAFAGLDPKVEFGPSFRGVPFAVIQWRMAPHAVLPAHCHPQASVCTVGMEGEARLRHFEVDGPAPAFDSGSRAPFLIRETRRQIVAPRRISTLSSTRDNIHYFEAGDAGARGLDITTAYGGDGSFSFVSFQPDKPKDAEKGLYEAVWTGMKL